MQALYTFVNIPQLTICTVEGTIFHAAFLYSIYHQRAGKTSLFHMRGVNVTHFNTCSTFKGLC